ncbi:MAG: PAS domain S-box protein, partial [Acidobacteria bacterium]|nr:PAS domain S-box protein [Acidobacteriota bacterium]
MKMPLIDRHQVDHHLRLFLIKHAKRGIYGTSASVPIAALLVWKHVAHSWLLAWVAAHVAVNAFRLIQLNGIHREMGEAQVRSLVRKFLVFTAVSGLLWGLSAWFFMPSNDPLAQGALTILIGALCAGTVLVYSAVEKGYVPFVLLAGAPLLTRFLAEGQSFYLVFALSLVFAWIIMATGHTFSVSIRKSIEQNLEKIALLERVQISNQAIEELNRELESRVQARTEHLEKLQADYQVLFQSSHDAIIVLEPFSERVLAVNRRATEIYGLTEQEFIGRSLRDFSLDTTTGDQLTPQILDSDQVFTFETHQKLPNGKQILLEISASAIVYQGKKCILSINRDITESRAMERMHRQSEKLRALGQLTSGIAHDFNNQLNGILGMAELLQSEIDNPIQIEQINKMIQSAENAAQLIQSLLSFSRFDKKRLHAFDVHVVIQESLHLFARTLPPSIQLQTTLAAKDSWILGDAVELENAFLNLLLNARDAIESNGRIHVHTCNKTLSPEKEPFLDAGNYLSISFEDNGVGMDEATQSRIFEPFFTTKSLGMGSGLGLSAVYGTVQHHRGHIALQSKPGEGSCFELTFPLSTETTSG